MTETICNIAIQGTDLSGCKFLGLDLVDWGTLVAGVVALGAIARFLLKLTFRRGHLNSFSNLCRAIRPLMADNYRIFRTFGPNSGYGSGLPKNVRFDLSVWQNTKPKIVENNAKVKSLITTHFALIPETHQPVFEQWVSHIDAFEAHVSDPSVDYRDNQFPIRASEIVNANA